MGRMLIALTAVSAFLPGLALAQITEVTVRVDGLSCPFCAYSLEKKLKAVEGVAKLTIHVADGVATLTPSDGVRIDFAGLPRAVTDAGFTPREIRARGTGQVRRDGDRLTLIDGDGSQFFLLEPNELADRLVTEVLLAFEGFVTPPMSGASSLPRLSLTVAIPESETKDG